MKKCISIINMFLICSALNAQEFNNCEVDFSILKFQHPFAYSDIGKWYLVNQLDFPDYSFTAPVFKSRWEIEEEFMNQIKDNKEYNSNNKLIADSLLVVQNKKLDSIVSAPPTPS